MIKKLSALGMLALATGCMSIKAPEVACWPLEYCQTAAKGPSSDASLRLLQLGVRSPYDVRQLVVRRANGTVAFDPYNEFAALPASLIKGVLYDALGSSGRYRTVLGPSSIARADLSLEVIVDKLYLDCRTEGKRNAVAAVLLRFVNRDNEVVSFKLGEGDADAADGDYGKAFSKAISLAIETALAK